MADLMSGNGYHTRRQLPDSASDVQLGISLPSLPGGWDVEAIWQVQVLPCTAAFFSVRKAFSSRFKRNKTSLSPMALLRQKKAALEVEQTEYHPGHDKTSRSLRRASQARQSQLGQSLSS